MDREIVLAVLMLAGAGASLAACGRWPVPEDEAVNARRLESRRWLILWRPTLPAAALVFWLIGWAFVEPENAEVVPWSLAILALLFSGVCIRALVRSIRRLRAPSHVPAYTAGLWHPKIVLSTQLAAILDDEAREAVVAHERAHARHRDPLRVWLAEICTDLQWPCSAATARLHRWHEALELARDEDTRRTGVDGADLAAAILVAHRLGGHRSTAAAGRSANEAVLRRRIAALLAPLSDEPSPSRPRLAVRLALVSVCIGIAISGGVFGESLVRAFFRALP